MKRILIGATIFFGGLLVGAGALYVGLNWQQFNPLRPEKGKAEAELLLHLRRACAKEETLRGVFVKSAVVNDERVVVLRGLAAKKDQSSVLEGQLAAFLEQNAAFKAVCSGAIAAEFHVLAIDERLAQLQPRFEIGPVPEAKGVPEAVRREIMRTTRLDGSRFSEDGKLTFSAVSIRDNSRTADTNAGLKTILESWLTTLSIPPEHMPEVAVEVTSLPNPAVALREKIGQNPQLKGVHLLSSWYDGKGRLHFEGLIAKESQEESVRAILQALKSDPQAGTLVKSPSLGASSHEVTAQLRLFDGPTIAAELRQKLGAWAREQKKDYLRRVWIADVVPTLEETKDEGKRYVFRVTGRRLEAGASRRKEMDSWLNETELLPLLRNTNQARIEWRDALADMPSSPIYDLQERVVKSRVDGALFTDAVFDAQGRPVLEGHHPGTNPGRAEVQAIVKEMLAEEVVLSLEPHSKEKQPRAWGQVLDDCRDQLARHEVYKRLRLDRMYFRYDAKRSLLLISDGVFLQNVAEENPELRAFVALDLPLQTRTLYQGTVLVNPLADIQDQVAENPGLDGALISELRYDRKGHLQFAGMLGRANHKAQLTELLTRYLEKDSRLTKKSADGKGRTWSDDGITFAPTELTNGNRSELLRACQNSLASSKGNALFRRVCVERIYFKYHGARELTLSGQATYLEHPANVPDFGESLRTYLLPAGNALLQQQKVDKKMAPAKMPEHPIRVQHVASPVFKLQDDVIAKGIDGIFFREAYYDGAGKLAFEGIYGAKDQLKDIQAMLDGATADKKTPIAPFGLASLASMRLVPWPQIHAGVLGRFSAGAGSTTTPNLFRHTHIERADFKYVGPTATAFFQGVCLYYGNKLSVEEQNAALERELEQYLQSKTLTGFKADVGKIVRRQNPEIEMQEAARKRGMDGVLFRVGFDETGKCCVKMPFMVKGQEDNVRKLVEEFSKKNPELGPLQLQIQELAP